jgi:hypothetical protein
MKNYNTFLHLAVYSLFSFIFSLSSFSSYSQTPIPGHVGSITDGDGGALLDLPYSVYLSDNFAYVASFGSNALEIIDVANPSAPIHMASLIDGEGGASLKGPSSVFVSGNYAYVASESSNALEIVDVSAPAVPVHKGSLTNGTDGALLSGPQSVYVSGNYAYVASAGSNALEIVDVTDPTAPVHKGSLTNTTGGALLEFPKSVYVSGNYAYVASESSNALEIVDVSDPAVPVHKGSLTNGTGGALLNAPYSVYVSGNYAYVASFGSNALEIVDVSDPAAPVHKGSLTNGSGGAKLDAPSTVFIDGNFAYIGSQNSSALEIVDISNPNLPIHSTSITAPIPLSIFVKGNFVYLTSSESTSLEVYSIFYPLKPQAIEATSVTGTSFIANCNWVSNATSGYFLDVSKDNFATYIPGYENLAGAQSIAVTGLDPVTTYQYRFRAANPNGTSDNSNVITVATTPPAPVATAATNISTDSFTANWEAVTGAERYYLEVATNLSFSNYVAGFSGATAYESTVTSQDITGLTAGVEYFYRVTSEIATTRSVPSNVISQFTASGSIIIQPVTNVSETSFTINWETLSGVTNYFITVSANANLSDPLIGYDGTTAIDPSQTSENVTGLASGTAYYYQIVASTAGGSDAISSIESQLTYPSAPTANAATSVSSSSFIANWSTVTGADNYYLQVSVNNSFSSYLAGYDGTVAMGPSTTTETVSGLGAGTTYYYRVIGENSTGQSDPSNTITVSTLLSNPIATGATSVGENSFVANWEVVNGASEYELEISTDEFITFIDGYSPKTIATTQELVDGLTPETAYSYRVRAKNSSGVSGNSNTITTTTLQTGAGNTILNLSNINYVNTQENNATQTVSFSVSGGTRPYNVTLEYRGLLSSNFTEVQLTAIAVGEYSFDITADLLDELGLEFMVTVVDGLMNSTSDGAIIYHEVSDTESADITARFENNFGGGEDDWNLFSVPYDLDDKSVSNIFSEYDLERHLVDWKIVRYRASSNDFVSNATGQINLGEAYWFNAKEKKTVKVGSGKVTDEIPFGITVNQGWNLIGNPFPVDIAWEQVILNNPQLVIGELQVFKNRTQEAESILRTYGGGYVFVDASGEISIDPVSSKTGGRLAGIDRIENMDIDWDEWLLNFELVDGENVTATGGIGMHPEANNLKDYFDVMLAPRFYSFTDIYTEHQDYFYPYFKQDVVETSQDQTWAFSIETNRLHNNPVLQWDNTGLQNSKATLYLLDKQSGQLVDMKSQNTHPVNLTEETYEFEIFYSIEAGAVLPSDLVLGTAYPNPASRTATIPVIVPDGMEDRTMNLTVFDINGREMATLANDKYSQGYYEFEWDIAAEENNVNGLFIYRLTFSGSGINPIQKKLIVR